LRPVLEHDEKHVKAQGSNLTVKAHPSGDSISCMLESSTGSVDLKLNLPRVWWKLTCDNSWRDTPLEMTQQEFRKYAKQNAAIELRLPRRIRSVGVGFNDELERKYQRYMAQDSVSLPMKNFSDYSQIDQRLMEDALFNIRCDKEVLTLIKISADHAPNSDIQNTTKNITVFPIFKQGGKLAAIVRTSNNGWRQSRGFSVGEVRGADLTVDECRRREIRIDKRRRTAHPNNIQVIRRLVDVKRNTGLG
ncbi:MAG: hypothetical protein OYH77_08600, partial [Pseudomonadota bacterium]|nr:hypothetical protein [Pseudomonadota bacterium]